MMAAVRVYFRHSFALSLLAICTLTLLFSFPSSSRDVNAHCGVGAGGNLTANNITNNCGLSEAEIKLIISEFGGLVARELVNDASAANQKLGQAEERLVALSKRLQVRQMAVLTYFRILQQEDVPDDKLIDKFSELAAQHRHLLDQRATVIRSKSPKVKKLLEEADRATDDGDYVAAQAAISAAFKAQRAWNKNLREKLDEGDLSAAEIIARNGNLSLGQLAYLEAAAYFAEAVETVPSGYQEQRLFYLEKQAGALETHGHEKGVNHSLRNAIDVYREVLSGRDRINSPQEWANSQINLGNALSKRGALGGGSFLFEEAVVAYRTALEERTRDRVPLEWALIQNNLGLTLLSLGERYGDTARLEEAVVAFRSALEERTRKRAPLSWARTQNNLGNALWKLGEGNGDTARLEEAVVAYRAALEEDTRDRVPLDWATTQNNLGFALWRLGERDGDTARLEEAVVAYRAALEERIRERVPLKWADTQYNLGNAFVTFEEQNGDAAWLKEAVMAYRAALEEQTRERVPLKRSITQNNLGNALWKLGERLSSSEILIEAKNSIMQAQDGSRLLHGDLYDQYFTEQLDRLVAAIEELTN
ncbi:MAG: tetratricopeptide repeat protein [Rhizobiaceae bacterium]